MGRRGETGAADRLNERQRRFVLEYLSNGGNGTEAAIAAGYSPRSAAVQASRLLRDDNVQAYRRTCARELYNALGLTPEQIGLKIWDVFQRCMQAEKHLSWDQEAHAFLPDGSWQFDAKNALRALELLGKQTGIYQEKVQVSGSVEDYLRSLTERGEAQSF